MSPRDSGNFVVYEYKEVLVEENQASLYMDAYGNFGWEIDERAGSSCAKGRVNLHFRRDRKIINKMELTRLQRNFDACMEEIRQLEASRESAATMAAIALGIAGTAFMAGAVFAVTAPAPMIFLCIALAVPGFAGWIFPLYLYRYMVRKRAEKIAPLIDAKYEEAYAVCEKGSRLLQ